MPLIDLEINVEIQEGTGLLNYRVLISLRQDNGFEKFGGLYC